MVVIKNLLKDLLKLWQKKIIDRHNFNINRYIKTFKENIYSLIILVLLLIVEKMTLGIKNFLISLQIRVLLSIDLKSIFIKIISQSIDTS